ncbi:Unknown protein, partial [Striga hermonthica]
VTKKLQKFSLSVEESGGVEIQRKDIVSSEEECVNSLFGKVIGNRKASLLGVKRAMSAIWRLHQRLEVRELETNFFQFIFSSEDDRKRVMAGHSWLLENQYLVLREWRRGLTSRHRSFDQVNLWVHVLNVPFNWMSSEVGLKIGEVFEGVKNVTICRLGGDEGNFIKLLATINTKEPLPRCTVVKLEDQQTMVQFKYERLVNLCYYCGCIGHLDKNCETRLMDIENRSLQEGQFGDWLKAAVFIYGNRHSVNSGSEPKESSPAPNPKMDTSAAASTSRHPPHSEKGENREGGSSVHKALSTKEGGQSLELVMVSPLGEEEEIAEVEIRKEGDEKRDIMVIEEANSPLIDVGVEAEVLLADSRRTWRRAAAKAGRLLRSPVIEGNSISFSGWKRERNKEQDLQVKSKGRLLLMWDQEVEIRKLEGNEFCIQVEVRGPGMSEWCWLVFVYISTDRNMRSMQWEILLDRKVDWGSCWAIAGDWNEIVSNEEKRGGLVRSHNSFLPFRDFIVDMEMQEQDQKGAFFTWGNNRRGDGYVEERLDKVFTSQEWLLKFPKMEVSNFFRSASDHNVILYDTEMELQSSRRRFVFDRNWLKMEGIEEAVAKGWEMDSEGSEMFKIHQKVKHTKKAILSWYNPVKRNNEKLIQTLTAKMEKLREEGREKDWVTWCSTKCDLDKAYMEEEQYWRAKSRALWLKVGDKNTRFFHAFAAQRRKRNSVLRLVSGTGEVITEPKKLEEHIVNYYSSLFKSEGSNRGDELLNHIPQTFVGQKVNLHKSSMFLSKNCSVELKEKICSILPGVIVKRSSRYLGLPLGIGASKIEAFQFVVDAVRNRICSWKNQF